MIKAVTQDRLKQNNCIIEYSQQATILVPTNFATLNLSY